MMAWVVLTHPFLSNRTNSTLEASDLFAVIALNTQEKMEKKLNENMKSKVAADTEMLIRKGIRKNV